LNETWNKMTEREKEYRKEGGYNGGENKGGLEGADEHFIFQAVNCRNSRWT